MTGELPAFDHEALRASIDADRALWRERMMQDWIWSQVRCPSPLPMILITGI